MRRFINVIFIEDNMNEDEETRLFNIILVCIKCEWKGLGQDADRVPDPRGDAVWLVCPSCRTPEHLVPPCDGPDFLI